MGENHPPLNFYHRDLRSMQPRLQRVHRKFPGLPAAALDFFSPSNVAFEGRSGLHVPRTVAEFAERIARPGSLAGTKEHPPLHQINLILRRMADLNFLVIHSLGGNSGWDASYLCVLEDQEKQGILNNLDYAIYGFPIIYEELQHSVIPIIHHGEKRPQIGSSFLHKKHVLVTAAHCIKGAQKLSIRGVSADQFRRARIAVHRNEALDLAAINFSEPIFPDIKEIGLTKGTILDEILVLGYPDVPGFTRFLAAEKAAVSARITVTAGAIASSATDIFAQRSLFLITARVRGGFSGGPVINDHGLAVGLVSRQPISSKAEDGATLAAQYDDLGYGVAIPAEEVFEFLNACEENNSDIADFIDGTAIRYCEFSE